MYVEFTTCRFPLRKPGFEVQYRNINDYPCKCHFHKDVCLITKSVFDNVHYLQDSIPAFIKLIFYLSCKYSFRTDTTDLCSVTFVYEATCLL